MYVAGFKFHLLNNAFTSHWGFQVTSDPPYVIITRPHRETFQSLKSRPSWRAKQQEENNARFDEFAREVTIKKKKSQKPLLVSECGLIIL